MNNEETPWFAYVALLADGRFYVGMTHVHPDERAKRHQSLLGGNYTRKNRVEPILWYEKHPSSDSARHRERQLKCWSHAKKAALIAGDFDTLKRLARSRQR